ncbi:MAG: DUF4129 domain-containing protein [Chloroflexi bacterium]|nr:DUF4129 domain-containing protein [Chloroflexota bacterium]
MSTLISTLTQPEKYAAFLRTWARVQHELLYVVWGVMETALFAPIMLSFMVWARYWPPGQVFLWFLLLMFFSFNLGRFISTLQIAIDHQRTISAVVLLLTIFFSIRGLVHSPQSLFDFSWITQFVSDVAERGNARWTQDVSIFAAVVIMWWRGIRLGNRKFSMNAIGLRLRMGGLLIAPLIVWLGSRRLLWDVSPFLLLYFLAALTAVSLIRAEQLEKDRSKQSASLDPRWLIIIFIASLLIIFMAGLLTVIITGKSAGAVVGTLSPLIIATQFLASVALSTLLFVTIPVFELIDILVTWLSGIINNFITWIMMQYAVLQKILGKIVGTRPAQEETESGLPDVSEGIEEIRKLNIGNLQESYNILAILLFVAIVLIVALTISRSYRATKFAERESGSIQRRVIDKGNNDSLLNLLLKRLGFLQNWRAAASIRRVYRQMLAAADASGYPRLDSETPYEYLKTLQEAWPDHHQQTQIITSAYINVRYGEIPETEAELDAILAAWDQLETAPPETAVSPDE